MNKIHDWNELHLSEEPAIDLLQSIGYTFILSDELALIVKSKAEWIIKKLRSLDNLLPDSTKEFVSGESFSYLGRHLRLKILRDTEKKKPLVKLHGSQPLLFLGRGLH